MKSLFLLASLFVALTVNAKQAPDREYFCNGGEYKNKQALTFTLFLANHNGKTYKIASIENMFFNNTMRDSFETDKYDISKAKMKCAHGKKRTGAIQWQITETGDFTFESQCKEDSLQIQAHCVLMN